MPLDQKIREAIREAFLAGTLQCTAVTITGDVVRAPIKDILQHHTPNVPMYRITTKGGRIVEATLHHSLFRVEDHEGIMVPVEARTDELKVGEPLAVMVEGALQSDPIISIEVLPPEHYTYDLSVPGPENFVLTNGILAHNSYSIGGISLDLEKSSKYQSAMSSAKELFQEQKEAAKSTVKLFRGLKQSRYGQGIRSSFGPATGRGILTPAKFISAF